MGVLRIEEKGRCRRQAIEAEILGEVIIGEDWSAICPIGEEGRCFRCGDPFAPGHRCSEKGLRVPLLPEEEDEVGTEEGSQEGGCMELSACSAEGMTS